MGALHGTPARKSSKEPLETLAPPTMAADGPRPSHPRRWRKADDGAAPPALTVWSVYVVTPGHAWSRGDTRAASPAPKPRRVRAGRVARDATSADGGSRDTASV